MRTEIGGREMDNNIYKILTAKNMTQAELARKVGVRREYINRIIHRLITPTVPLGMRIARTLGKTMEDVWIVD
jgi:DNA-binding XRE family transcriptional regulator